LNDTETESTFKPIFPAMITPGVIEEGRSNNKNRTVYLRMTGSTFKPEKTEKQEHEQDESIRTVMAFGRSVTAVREMLVEGVPVRLACQYDGGSVRVIGPVIEKKKRQA